MLDLALRFVVVAIAGLFLFMGAGFVLDPVASAADIAVTPVGEHGLNTLRGDIGGLFIGSAILLLLGILRRRAELLIAVAVLMGTIAAGRIVGFVVDGNVAQMALVAFGFEVGMAVVLLVTARAVART